TAPFSPSDAQDDTSRRDRPSAQRSVAICLIDAISRHQPAISRADRLPIPLLGSQVPRDPGGTMGSPATRTATPRHYLMCPPVHYDVTYAINPWMDTTRP